MVLPNPCGEVAHRVLSVGDNHPHPPFLLGPRSAGAQDYRVHVTDAGPAQTAWSFRGMDGQSSAIGGYVAAPAGRAID